MQPGGYYPRANAPSYGYGNGNGGGFRNGRGPPYRPPAPPAHQMTPQQREQVMMAAGRLAAEYLVHRGDLPPAVLENRPLAPIPSFQQGPPAPRTFRRFQGRPPAPPPPQYAQPAEHRPFHHFQGHQQRPPARRFPGPRPFQGGHGPFPKRPRQGPPRSFPYGPRAQAPPKKTGFAAGPGQAAAPSGAETKMQGEEGQVAVAGEASDSQPGGASPTPTPTSGQQQMDEPSSA